MHTREKIRELLSRVEPKTFRLLVRMLYHWAKGDSWGHIIHGTVRVILWRVRVLVGAKAIKQGANFAVCLITK